MTRRAISAAILAGSLILAVMRVAATHPLFSPTWDEPAHIYAGYQYLAYHQYTFDKTHPPLARILFALPLRHARTAATDDHERIGQILASRGSYMAGVVAARRGNLPFLAVAIAAVAALAAFRGGVVEAVIAAALFSLLPPVLAHGGLATTDMACTAGVAAAMAALWKWLEEPDWLRTLLLGVVIGLGLLTKFSFPIFFGIAALVFVVSRRRLPPVRLLVALLVALTLVWSAYFFRRLPLFFTGFASVLQHNASGHQAYFAGHVQTGGAWDYFAVILAIKTPIPFLILAVAGIIAAFRTRENRDLVAIAGATLLLVSFSRINLGVRHILPLYVPLAILASSGALALWRSRARWSLVPLCAWLLVNSATAHPDYLPWMNAFAGRHPERVVLDSNFDWGQDVLRLRDACRALRIPDLGVGLFGTVDLPRIGMPPTRAIDPHRGAPGWYAVSESYVIPAQVTDPSAFRWLTDHRSFRRIGKSIRLYEVR